MFNMKFKVVEIRESGLQITHYLYGRRKDVLKDIEMFKQSAKSYDVFGKEGMVVRT